MLILRLDENGNGHDDVTLTVSNDFVRRCDSYYFRLDTGIDPGDESSVKARKVMLRLLEQWSELVRGLSPSRPRYLPFDFSDQYTGWLRVTDDSGGAVYVDVGWSPIEGWSFLPSDVAAAEKSIEIFSLFDGTPRLHAGRDEVQRWIEESRIEVAGR